MFINYTNMPDSGFNYIGGLRICAELLLISAFSYLLKRVSFYRNLSTQSAKNIDKLVEDLNTTQRVHLTLREEQGTHLDKQNQKLDALSCLATGVAHDLNNALAIILCMVETHNEIDPKVISAITAACLRGRGVLQSLLYFSKGSLGIVEQLSINQVITSTLETIGIQIETELSDVPYIMGDQEALEHAITQLLLNAKEATSEGNIWVRTRGTDSSVFLEIQDTGVGMSPDILAKATEPSFSTKTGGKCSGLGLASVKSIVEAHSGTLIIDSTRGIGTKVMISFPASNIKVLPHTRIQSDSLHIMIVDDDELLCLSLTALLEMLGHTVTTLYSGYDAIKQLEAGVRPNILILDMYLSDINADLIIPRVLRICPTQRILLSSGAQTDAIESILKTYPHVAKISKPFSANELSQYIQYLCLGDS